MKTEEQVLEVAKQIVSYDRQIEIVGLEKANTVLYFTVRGYKQAISDILQDNSNKPAKLNIHKLNRDNIPDKEVIAFGHTGLCLVGYIADHGGSMSVFSCESEETNLQNVTHFIEIPVKGVHYDF